MKSINRESLVNNLISGGYLKTPRIIEAFRCIDRADFVPENLKEKAYVDAPLSIGKGQTISQPLTVAFMLELLCPELGNKILDVGYGSGWTTALLAEIIFSPVVILSEGEQGEAKRRISLVRSFAKSDLAQDDNEKKQDGEKKGKVYAIERVPELCEFGKENVGKYNFIETGRVEMKCGDGTKGWIENAPFDRILAGAAGDKIPEDWKKQLKIGGRIVAPVGNSIWLVIRKGEDDFEEIEYPGFSFVPLIGS